MDQVKIGAFIQATRKELSLTQRALAERLDISDKTVSKWETGNGLPEVGLMLPLCRILGISVNELLSGERLDEKKYFENAEKNIMTLMQEKQDAKRKIALSVLVIAVTLLSGITIVLLAGIAELSVWVRCILIAIALIDVGGGIAAACILDRVAGVYECPACGERFVPDMKSYVFGPHTFTKRWLKCPKCGEKRFCRKRFANTDESKDSKQTD